MTKRYPGLIVLSGLFMLLNASSPSEAFAQNAPTTPPKTFAIEFVNSKTAPYAFELSKVDKIVFGEGSVDVKSLSGKNFPKGVNTSFNLADVKRMFIATDLTPTATIRVASEKLVISGYFLEGNLFFEGLDSSHSYTVEVFTPSGDRIYSNSHFKAGESIPFTDLPSQSLIVTINNTPLKVLKP